MNESTTSSMLGYESDNSNLSGSDFTLYSDEALSDDIKSDTEGQGHLAANQITEAGKRKPPLRPPPPKAVKEKKSPVTKRKTGRRKPSDGVTKPSPTGNDNITSTEEEAPPTRAVSANRRNARPANRKPERKRSPQPSASLSATDSSRRNKAKAAIKTPSKSTRKDRKDKREVPTKDTEKLGKKFEISVLATSVSSSLSIEEVRAAGDGASEDNDPIDLKSQTLVAVEEEETISMPLKPLLKLKRSAPKRFGQSASIDSQPALSDAVESGREETTSDTSDTLSDSDEPVQEGPKSSQWLDFQAMTERITTTVKKTSTNMQKIADSTNITKLVGGLIREEAPRSKEGAWEKVDETPLQDSDSSHDFDDEYDPVAEADAVGQAFGDYKQNKKRKKKVPEPVTKEFEDAYNPGVDSNDPLAGAFGDGFRTSKPVEPPSCEFDDDFGEPSSTKLKQTKNSTSLSTVTKKPKNKKEAKPAVSTSKDPKPKRPTDSPSLNKPARPSQPTIIRSAKPQRPAAVKTSNTKNAVTVSQNLANADRAESKSTPPKKAADVGDLLGSIESETTQPSNASQHVVVENAEVHMPPSNFDLLIGAANEQELTTEFRDDALEGFELTTVPAIPKVPELARIQAGEAEDLRSRSSSADHLDAFQFFNPETSEATGTPLAEPKTDQYLMSPQINIIAASNENLAADDLNYLDSLAASSFTNTASNELVFDPLDPLIQEADDKELHIDTSSSSESETENGGKLVRDDTIDFDEIISRPSAERTVSQSIPSNEMWGDTEDSGIGVEFKATFSTEDDLDKCAFGGNETFESLIGKYSDVADGKTPPEELGAKARQEVKGCSAVSAKRAMKFARTFSETIDEDDDETLSAAVQDGEEDDPLSVKASTGLGLVVNPMETDREDADGEESEDENKEKVLATSSHRHVWIDMSKPMPRAQAKPTTSKEKAAKPAESSIKLLSQEARQNMQVKVKPVPRPKGREVQPSPDATPVQTKETGKTKKLVTQGQADHLNLSQLKEHTTLTFEIDTKRKKNKAAKAVNLPVLPPPPKTTTPQMTRKNPFNKRDSSDSEQEAPVAALVMTETFSNVVDKPDSAPLQQETASGFVGDEIDEEEGDTDCLIGADGGQVGVTHKWEAFEKAELPPLEDFHPKYDGHGWKMLIRKPPKKSLTKKRFWEDVYVRLDLDEKDIPCILLYRNEKDATKGAKELERTRLNPFHQLSDNIYLQQYDQYGKCHSIKVLHVSYKERPSLRTDRVTEALPNFIKGYMKPNKSTIFEHAPIITELYKFGSLDYQAMRMFVWELENCLRNLKTERINTNTVYQKNEIVADAWDEYEACLDRQGHIVSHKARVRLFMLCFVTGMPIVEVGINDRRRRGKEVVRRHEIIPVKAENWITVENVELHKIVKEKEYNESGVISYVPLDGCKFEFMRFRYRPKKNRELPLQIGTKMVVDRQKRVIELRADLLIPGYYSNSKRKGQVPCENIQICFPIPDTWVYKFRVEKHQKMGSLHAAARKPGKVKGLERITTAFGKAVENYLPPSFIECSVGDAKYEHIFRSVVWRVEKLPRFNEGAYKSHYFALRLELGKHDIIPDSFEPNIRVEFVMPHTTVSGTAIRSISCAGLDEPPEKWVHHHAKYEYTVEIDFESEIKQLLPDENYVSASDDKPANTTPVKTAKKMELSDDEDVSSIEIDETREDSDDTDNEEDEVDGGTDDSESDEGDSSDNSEAEATAETQEYATLLDLEVPGDGADAEELLDNTGTHLSELLNLTEVTESSSHAAGADVQTNDLNLL